MLYKITKKGKNKMFRILCERTQRAFEKDQIDITFKVAIGKEIVDKARQIFDSYGVTIEDGIICMIKRTYEFDDVPFFELIPEEDQEINF